ACKSAGLSETGGLSAGPAELAFGRNDVYLDQLHVGQRVWKTDDPELTKRLRRSFEGAARRKVDLDIKVRAVVGEPLALEGSTATGFSARVEPPAPLEAAERQVATPKLLREGLDRLGGTTYRLGRVEATIEGGPLVPKSVLNGLRRDLVARLD